MITEEQKQAFVEDLTALQEKHGFTLQATLQLVQMPKAEEEQPEEEE